MSSEVKLPGLIVAGELYLYLVVKKPKDTDSDEIQVKEPAK